jgi:serine/threonine protein kinase
MSNKIKIGKTIDKSILSSVHDCTLNGKKYIVKIAHVTKKEVNVIDNELNFSLHFGNKYPEYFMQLIDYYFEEGCPHIKISLDVSNPYQNMRDKVLDEYKKRINENMCSYKIYTKMDVILNNILTKLSHLQIYSMLLQVSYILKFMHKNDYIHGDVHLGNIGAMKTTMNTKINLGPNTIHTYGYKYKLIDFGMSLYKKDVKSLYDKKRFSDELDYTHYDGLLYALTTQLNNDDSEFDDIIKKIKKTKEFSIIKEIVPTNKIIQIELYKTLFTNKYITLCTNKGTIRSDALLPVNDIIFFARYGIHSDETYQYLLSKLSK